MGICNIQITIINENMSNVCMFNKLLNVLKLSIIHRLKIILYFVNHSKKHDYRKYNSKPSSTSTSTMAMIRNTARRLSAKLRPVKKPGYLSVPKHSSLAQKKID